VRILKKVAPFVIFLIIILTIMGAKPKTKSKFYDFDEQLIDGKINKPTTLYTDARQQVKFERLLKLKKSFLNDLFDTAKERVFK
tara:strand:- start:840 stop:1091 length:252 start_codon:yes stop_codon:yes gene_type:complete